MAVSSRCAMAIHALTYLAHWSGVQSSSRVAESLGSSSVFVRRILGQLRDASLVTSYEGSGGGWSLARESKQITLYDVYVAVEDRPALSLHRHPNPECVIGRNIQAVLEREFSAAEEAMREQLRRTSIADLARRLAALERTHA